MSDEYERSVLQNIEQHGWFCTSVVDPSGTRPAFSYSVGFTRTLDAPEFIVFGLDTAVMHAMLWNVFKDIQSGRQPHDHDTWSGLLANHDCVIRAVHPTNVVREYLNSALWLWGDTVARGPMPAFQIVWPNVGTNLFPWNDRCPQAVKDRQPPLYLPNVNFQ